MAFISVLSRDLGVAIAAERALISDCTVARPRSWTRTMALIAERPATGLVVDSDALGSHVEPAVVECVARFPSVWLVLVARPSVDPLTLFRLGKQGIQGLVLPRLDDVESGVRAAVVGASGTSTEALVARAVSPYLPAREAMAVRHALRGVQLGWTADDLALRSGLTRAHLSVRLKNVGLPSAGHLLGWAKLLHAGRWLSDSARTGQSVSRQLDYSSGAAFRRALRKYVGATPMQVREGGGLAVVLDAFLEETGLKDRAAGDRTAA